MLKFFRRILSVFNQSSWDQMIRDYLAGQDVVLQKDVSVYGTSALKFTAVFACCRVLAESFATVPVFEYKKMKNGGRKQTDATGLYDILHYAFNDEMAAYNAKEAGMYQLTLGGNAIYQKVNNYAGELLALYPIQWDRVQFEQDEITGRLYYIIDGKKDQKKTRDKIFHVPGPSFNGLIGMSPIEYAAQSIRLGLTYENFGVNFYKNGAMPSGVFEHPGMVKDDAYQRLKDSLKKEYSGMGNSGTPMLLEDGLKFSQMTMKLVDAELLGSKKFQIEDICRIYRVPLHLVQNLDRATNNNIEHQSLEFIMYTMLPYFKRWEECINTQLLSRQLRAEGYYFEFNLSTLLRGDQKSMAESFAIGRQWGYLSVNDIRRMLNMNKIKDGDIYLQPLNMVPAGTEIIQKPVNGRDNVDDKIKKEIAQLMEEAKV